MEKNDISATLLAIYLWMFIILRVAWRFNDSYSTIILGGLAIIIIISSIYKSKNFVNKNFVKGFLLISLILLILLLSVVLNNNEVIFSRTYEFVIYGAIPIVLLTQVKDFEPFFRAYFYLSIIVFILYVIDPLNHYLFSTSYMVYGYQAMLPAFFGLHIGRKKYKIKYLLILEIITIIMLVIFGNRMASISVLLFIFTVDFLYTKISLEKIIKYLGLSLLTFTFMMNIQKIVSFVVEYLVRKGYTSYSLNAILLYLNGSVRSLSLARDNLWESAYQLILSKPIFGHGVGYFESIYGIYVHNIFIDIALSFGIVGLLIISILLINSISKLKTKNMDLRLFGILILCTTFPKLLVSIYYFIEPTFWLLIFYGVYVPQYTNHNEILLLKRVNIL